jgi:alginate O-acetyltransferase complex protein AlgI
MVFSSIEFLFYFLPLCLMVYYVSVAARTPIFVQNFILLVFSLAFYAWGGGVLLGLMIAVALGNYVLALLVQGAAANKRLKVAVLVVAIAVNLGALAYFKYANFFLDQWNAIADVTPLRSFEWATVVLPIGISFYIFQAMSYVIDTFRGDTVAFRNPFDALLYIAFFPQLIAGPIVRFKTISDQMKERRATLSDFADGAAIFLHGLFKKIVIADSVAPIADAAFGMPPGELGMAAAWIGAFAYAIQIYFDFSGYSDMAIGLGRMFGFNFPVNFMRPYSALSITDFWRRWHITLSSWFRDYLYVPLGGSHVAPWHVYLNLTIVFLATGLWHGANWTFVLWGVYHGAILIFERATGLRTTDSSRVEWLRRGITFLLVLFGWILFRATDIDHAGGYYAAMFDFGNLELPAGFATAFSVKATLILAASTLVLLLPRNFAGGQFLASTKGPILSSTGVVYAAASVCIIALFVASQNFSPFLYFQF